MTEPGQKRSVNLLNTLANIEMEDTIRQKGFLSQEIDNYQVRYRERYAHVFQISDQVSQDATALIFGTNMRQLQGGTTPSKLMAVAYWLRSVRTCQGALRMLEIGMVPEAQILLRSAYEFLFFGAACSIALNPDPDVRLLAELTHSN